MSSDGLTYITVNAAMGSPTPTGGCLQSTLSGGAHAKRNLSRQRVSRDPYFGERPRSPATGPRASRAGTCLNCHFGGKGRARSRGSRGGRDTLRRQRVRPGRGLKCLHEKGNLLVGPASQDEHPHAVASRGVVVGSRIWSGWNVMPLSTRRDLPPHTKSTEVLGVASPPICLRSDCPHSIASDDQHRPLCETSSVADNSP